MADLFSFQLTSLAIPQALAAGLCVMAGGFALPLRKDYASARWLLAVLGGAAWWAAAGAAEFCAANMAAKVFWSQVSYLGVAMGPVSLFHFAYTYTHDQQAPPRTLSAVVIGLGVVVVLSAATNQLHHLHWPEVRPIERDGLLFAYYGRGPGFWLTVAYCYGFMFASSVMLAAHTLNQRTVFRQQSIVILLATLAPWITSIAYVFRVGPLPDLDHTPVGFAFTGLILSWAVARARLFELVPIATNTLFLRLPDPVLVVDPSDRLVRANAAAIQRLPTLEPYLGQSLSAWLADRPQLLDALLHATAVPRRFALGEQWWTVEAAPLDDTGGQARGRILILRDITDARRNEIAVQQTQRELEQTLARADAFAREAVAANTAKSTFLTQVSHDLRTPLHAILGMADSLGAGNLTSTQREAVSTITDASDILLRLINDLLDLSRIEAGRLAIANEPYLLDDVLDQIADLLSSVARVKGLRLFHWIEPGVPAGLSGDAERFRQILFNLVGNAVKFTERGLVTLRARREDQHLVVEVADTGPGIAAEHLDQLFEPFNRGDPQTARRTEGTGLGLAITQRLAEAMQGQVTVRSEVGRGSVFTLTLPLVEAPEAAVAVQRLGDELDSLPVAVVLDDPTARRAALAGLRSLGLEATEHTFPLAPPPAERTALVVDEGYAGEESVAAWTAAGYPLAVIAKPETKPGTAHFIPLRRRRMAHALLSATPTEDRRFVAASTPRRRVLLADDNPLSRRVSSSQLARCNCEVTIVDGGRPALARLAEEDFDIIVLDGQMPDLNGWEVAQLIREWPPEHRNTTTPIVALTADLTPDSHRRWINAGVSLVLGKPIHTDRLHEALESFPARSGKLAGL